jgi:hypothetical protein
MDPYTCAYYIGGYKNLVNNGLFGKETWEDTVYNFRP